MIAAINGFHFRVVDNDFWPYFNGDWESDTKRLYAKYARPDRTIIDVGAWIGPTVLIGYAHNAKHIYAVEADPLNAHTLRLNCGNNYLDDRVTIINRCIHDRSHEVFSFGNSICESDSSTHTFGGRHKVLSSTLMDIIADNAIALPEVGLIKIDIEGSELLLVRDLKKLAAHKHLVVLLSLHQQFWKKIPAKEEALRVLFGCYDFFTAAEEEPIPTESLDRYIQENIHCLLVMKPKVR